MTNHFYIHVPFCNQKCPYCKFALTPVFDEFKKRRYIEYLKKEIKEYFQGPQAVNSTGFEERNCLSQIENSTPTAKEAYPKSISNATESQRGSFSLPNAFDTFGSKSMEEWTLKQRDSYGMTKRNEIDLSSSTDTGLCRDDKKYIKTIYFGGGTPSILSHSEIREILECFKIPLTLLQYNSPLISGGLETFIKGESKQENQEIEITLESNPEDITREYVEGLIDLGINRLSMGVQTLNDKSLKEIHRSNRKSIITALENIGSVISKVDHSWSSSLCEFFLSVDEIFVKIATYLNFAILENKSNTDNKMKHGRFRRLLLLLVIKVKKMYQKYIKNRKISVNIDFILGLPYTRPGEILQSIKTLHTQFPCVTHTSVYMLEDENYPKHWKSNSITENEMQAEFIAIMNYFESIGWNHYELSNFAKSGYESIHNRAYWNHSNSRGFGLSAASYEDGTRWNNASSFGKYYEGKRENEETLTNEQKEIETMMFGLRTSGFNIQNTELDISTKKILENREKGFLEIENTMIKPTKTGIFILDHIMSELISS